MLPFHTPRISRLWLPGLFLLCNFCVSTTANAATDGYTRTRYPIVLIHGMALFDDMLGVSGWYSIPRQLRKGGANVFVLQVSALNTTELRGEQAARQIETILATTGAEKVNLIGHSHGSPTARYLAGVYPHYVASVTSVHGVNWGTPVADAMQQDLAERNLSGRLFKGVMSAWGALVNVLSGDPLPQSYPLEIEALTTAKALAFNAQYPDGMPQQYCGDGAPVVNGIHYFSWTGNRVMTNLADLADYGLLASAALMDEPNDGLVPVCATYLGQVIRDNYRMNHIDAIDHLFGLHSSKDTDPPVVYRQQANRLQQLGL
ncbi:MAG TPA: triacylglycerol lipase [Candidatus Kapabacteria bacterium]|nr:triacylglycerol lipase [Candidatus Kapabacteria bacterium]